MTEDAKKVVGRSKGGIARKESLSPERRSEIARNAANAMHASRKKLVAIRKGNFKDELGIDAECYVLNDEKKTAVITQRGMGVILGLGDSGSRLPNFISTKTMSEHVGQELEEKIRNPVIFQAVTVGASGPKTTTAYGFEAAVLIDICKAVLNAKADGKSINPAVVAQAGIIMGASAKAGIQGLVYALAGYRPEIEEVIEAFKAFVQDEAKKYEKEFPTELYLEWARLYAISAPIRGRSWKHKHLTVDHVYYPLAKSNGKLLALLRDAKQSDGGAKKLFQFLNEVGAKALRMHLGRILEMAESSSSVQEYEAKISERFGGQQGFNFPNASPQPS